jgi:hypothetical protein
VSRIWVLEFQRGLADEVSDPGVDDRTDRVGVADMAREGCGVARASRRDAVRALCGVLLVAMGRLE